MRLLFFLLFLTLNTYSQRVLIENYPSLQSVALDSSNNQYLLYYKDHYEKINLQTLERKSYQLITDNNLFKPMIIDGLNYFVNSGGGMVYILENDTIKRIDRSYNHRMQHGAIIFTYMSKIFKYGGYGFWSNRNFFTYFDDKTKEWEVVDPINSENYPEGTSGAYHILAGDDIYIFNGDKINPHRRKERIPNNEVWKFSFKDHYWTFLGTNSFTGGSNPIKYKDKILFLGVSYITEIDIINNKTTLYEHGLFSPRMYKSYYLKNQFYCLINDKGNFYFQVIDEKDFFGKKISEKLFYKNYSYWSMQLMLYLILPALILLIAWRLYKLYKKQKKIVLLDNGLRFKNKFTQFDLESMEIIKTLLSEKEISSNNILQVVEKEQYSAAHNERIKVQKLNEINLKVKILLGIDEDIINSFKSTKDRRIRIYEIKNQYFYKGQKVHRPDFS